MVNIFLKNKAREIIKKYLFWVDFVDQSFNSIDEIKEKLKTIKSKVIYEGEFGEFYLTQEEADALCKNVKSLNIQEVLDSDTYPLYLIERLSYITNYSQNDLKNIPTKSEVVWLYSSGILMHFVFKDGRYIYPSNYGVDNPYRYGYMVVFNQNGLKGVYDIDSDSLKIPFEYSNIELLGNLAQLSKESKDYEIWDLDTDKILQKSSKKVLPDISDELKDKLNFSKVDLEDYIRFFKTAKTEQDLIKMGLWNANVGVVKVPSTYSSIIRNNSGVIRWEYPVSADIFDMSVELPIMFKKTDGKYVTLGINHEDIILEDRTILNNVVLPKKDELNIEYFQSQQKLPNYLKIKNKQFDDVDFSNNSVDEIIALSSEEFNEFISLLGNDNISMLMVYLKTLDDIELAEFFLYLEDVKLDENVEAPSAKEQFQNMLNNVVVKNIDDKIKASATLEIPLFIKYAKSMYHQALDFKDFIKAKYYPYKKEDATMQFEGYLFKTLYSEPMKFVPDYFNQVLAQFRDYYDEKNSEHQKIALHLARRFGLLINSLHVIQKYQEEDHDGLEWFLATFIEEIKKVDGNDILDDDKLVFYMMNTFASIIQENDNSYISSMIEVVQELMKFYPYLSESFLYALKELMKSVALKEINENNANRFLEIFEELPKLYSKLNYSKIMELKEMINTIIANDKPQDNKIFDKEGVKSKIILMNYLIDLEDLYNEREKDKNE